MSAFRPKATPQAMAASGVVTHGSGRAGHDLVHGRGLGQRVLERSLVGGEHGPEHRPESASGTA